MPASATKVAIHKRLSSLTFLQYCMSICYYYSEALSPAFIHGADLWGHPLNVVGAEQLHQLQQQVTQRYKYEIWRESDREKQRVIERERERKNDFRLMISGWSHFMSDIAVWSPLKLTTCHSSLTERTHKLSMRNH